MVSDMAIVRTSRDVISPPRFGEGPGEGFCTTTATLLVLAFSAKRLREKFADAFPEERLPQHDLDVIHTDDAKITGRIEVPGVRVLIPQFGEKTLKLTDIVSVRASGVTAPEEKVAAQPDP